MRSHPCLIALVGLLLAVPQTRGAADHGKGDGRADRRALGRGPGVHRRVRDRRALTAERGATCCSTFLPERNTLSAELIGYQAVTAEVTVAAGETAVADFRLTEQALGLDEIIVTGTPGGDAAPRDREHGHERDGC